MPTEPKEEPSREAEARLAKEGIVRLANTILEAQVNHYMGRAAQLKPSVRGRDLLDEDRLNDATGHYVECICRTCTDDWFTGHLQDEPVPFNFPFCCLVLDLNPTAVIEGIAKRRKARLE